MRIGAALALMAFVSSAHANTLTGCADFPGVSFPQPTAATVATALSLSVVRSGPSSGYDQVSRAPKGEALVDLGACGPWEHVMQSNGEQGWVPSVVLRKGRTKINVAQLMSVMDHTKTPVRVWLVR
ncbi:MAG: hypothetical protein INR62_05855 [Rhodospirillales bacterium]|nr:hypothetical protein [Acetobacter sp.]